MVQKRNGAIVNFDRERIVNAIERAMEETIDGIDTKLSNRIANKISDFVNSSDIEIRSEHTKIIT